MNQNTFIDKIKDLETQYNSGIIDSAGEISVIYYNDLKDYKNALFWVKKGAYKGDKSLQDLLYAIYARKWYGDIEPDEIESFEWHQLYHDCETDPLNSYMGNIKEFFNIKEKAEEGDAESQYLLAKKYYQESHCKQEFNEKYLYWLRKSADNGFSQAQFYLGYHLFYGDYFNDSDIHQAVNILENLNEDDPYTSKIKDPNRNSLIDETPSYETVMSRIYEIRDLVDECYNKYKRNNAFSQLKLAGIYFTGYRVFPNGKRAIELLKRVSKKDNKFAYVAHYALGLYYSHYLHNKPDYKKAFKHFIEAERFGCTDAYHHLAICYMEGKGVEKDKTLEQYYWDLASKYDSGWSVWRPLLYSLFLIIKTLFHPPMEIWKKYRNLDLIKQRLFN